MVNLRSNIKQSKDAEFIHVRVPEEVRNAFKALAASKGSSMTKIVANLIVDYLEKQKETA